MSHFLWGHMYVQDHWFNYNTIYAKKHATSLSQLQSMKNHGLFWIDKMLNKTDYG